MIMTPKGFVVALALAGAGLAFAACNTSKATIDTFAKFTSSTSPGEWISTDGLIGESQKARLFAAVAFENLEQDMARGHGEYLTSLTVLMDIPVGEQDMFRAQAQSNYPLLFAKDQRTAEALLTMLNAQRTDQ